MSAAEVALLGSNFFRIFLMLRVSSLHSLIFSDRTSLSYLTMSTQFLTFEFKFLTQVDFSSDFLSISFGTLVKSFCVARELGSFSLFEVVFKCLRIPSKLSLARDP